MNGVTNLFFQYSRYIIKADNVKLVTIFFMTGKMYWRLNTTNIYLISRTETYPDDRTETDNPI